MGMALGNGRMMDMAIKLAKDGDIGNSDAIALLQLPHDPGDLKQVLATFEQQLTREARAKLTLAAFVPLPAHVDNQRYEPIFDRYPISGRTYTTASGTVVLNEVQYYNGVMVQLFGECLNVAPVREALAGSGYQPMMLKYGDGRETAIAQFWSHNLSDTSLRPYNAIFITVVAVRDDLPAVQASLNADDNGASSVLSGLHGSFNPATSVYENSPRLFFVRLLDSTRVAIEVGRERMGTDKRLGTVEMTRQGRQLGFVIKDGAARSVARINVVVADDPAAYLPEVAKAAATAGIPFGAFPPGTEFVYPCVARIDREPVVTWQWRTDVPPRLQPVTPGSVVFDASSEEGQIMVTWGFRPRVLGYLPSVRGVVTGVPDPSPRPQRVRIVEPRAVVRLRPR
ncbi:MAG: hypothetical protein ACRD2I_18545, partial [Vicinamibacterales bacterium]